MLRVRNLNAGAGSSKISKTLSPTNAESQTKGIRRLVLPRRTEQMFRLSVKQGTHIREGLRKNRKFRGVYLAGTMARVQAGYAITSIANTISEEGRKSRTGVGSGGTRTRDQRESAGRGCCR